MNLRNVDLNLLVAFDMLMRERHVSRAAAHLGIGQPGMSAALSRLRHLFGDPLLVRRGNEMAPTDRALAIHEDVSLLLRQVTQVLEPPSAFSPETSDRTFHLRMSDLLSVLFLPGIVKRVSDQRSAIRLEIAHLSPSQTVGALERNAIDVALSTGLDIPKSVHTRHLFDDHVVCLARDGFKLSADVATAEAFAALPQIRVSQSPIDDRFADRQLNDLGLTRNVVVTVPHWLAVPEILAVRPLVSVMPASIARRLAAASGLRIHPLPFLESTFQWTLYWHSRHDADPGNRWLRDVILSCCAATTLPAGGS